MTTRGQSQGRQPRGMGDDPFTIDNLEEEEEVPKKKNRQLEGVTPTKFIRDWSKTMPFLAEFKRFMQMNRDTDIAHDPFKKCNYFLSLFEGMDTEGWVKMQDKWLEDIMKDSSLLPWQMNEWQVMEREFKKAFIDYARHEKANDELRKLKMKDSNIDGYITHFTQLTHQGGHNINEPTILTMFSQLLYLRNSFILA